MTDRHDKRGKIALVTGGSQGLGRAYAERLAAEGATVLVVDIQPDNGVTDHLLAQGAEAAEFHQLDLARSGDVMQFIETVIARHGRLDILVNNAGISSPCSYENTDLEYLRKVLTTNVEAAFLLCKGFAGSMMENRYGRIINIASTTLNLVMPDGLAYIMSKGAIVGMTRALATELGSYGITVNCIAPGLVRTPATEGARQGDEFFEGFAQMQAIKRPAVPQDLAGAMSFLASDDAAFITGQTLIVDGGMTRAI